MSEPQRKLLNATLFLALGFILFGVLALVNNLGFGLEVEPWDFWPVILILAGVGVMLQSRDLANIFDGFMLFAVGAIILVSNLQLFEGFRFHFDKWWPLLILYVGVKILLQALHKDGTVAPGKEDFVISAIFGGGDYRFEAKNLKSGRVTAIFGGGTINLHDAEMEGDSMVMQCFAMFGGIDIRVPDHWQVFVKATPILGGIDNKALTRPATGKPVGKTLYIEGMAVFGGIEIKN